MNSTNALAVQALHGDCSYQHVAAGNAVANILGELLLPLLMWLDLHWVMEQPATCFKHGGIENCVILRM